jgi:hypothetical protein
VSFNEKLPASIDFASLNKTQFAETGFSVKTCLKPPTSTFDINDISKPQSRRVHGKQSSADTEVYQMFKRKAAHSENILDKGLISHLKKWAFEGKIMHEYSELRENLAFLLRISKESASEVISTGCRVGKLMQQSKKIGTFSLNIISLRVDSLTVKVLLWVLRSLKADEMISTEKAI